MTELLAHQDSYTRSFEATVTTVNTEENTVTLDKTAFYPGGGGQPCDFGTLVGIGLDRYCYMIITPDVVSF